MLLHCKYKIKDNLYCCCCFLFVVCLFVFVFFIVGVVFVVVVLGGTLMHTHNFKHFNVSFILSDWS